MSSKLPRILMVLLISTSCLNVILPISEVKALKYTNDTPLEFADLIIVGEGENPMDYFGISMDLRGDYDGDGLADVLIGAPQGKIGGTNYGKAYLWMGNTINKFSGEINATNGSKIITGVKGNDYHGEQAGWYLSTAGDVNGDGFDDFLISGHTWSHNAYSDRGRVGLFYGRANISESNISLDDADCIFYQDAWKLSGGGDLNGDGYDDFIISEPYYEGHRGRIYIIFGKSEKWLGYQSLDEITVHIDGVGDDNETGWYISIIGDVNGDGYDDFNIVSNNKNDPHLNPVVSLFFGGMNRFKSNLTIADADVTFYSPNYNFGKPGGFIQSAGGDVDNDGYDDILIGLGNYAEQTVPGTLYLFFGRTAWDYKYNIMDSNIIFTGEEKNDRFGESSSIVGDVNGDGFDDILAGAPELNISGNEDVGKAYFFLGKARSKWNKEICATQSDASFMGEYEESRTGRNKVISGGDINGDGLNEIIIGAPGGGSDDLSPGRAYLIYLDNSTPPSSVNSLKFYKEPPFTTPVTSAWVGDEIYVELMGIDGDPSNVDVAKVIIESRDTDSNGITIILRETFQNSGVYRGLFKIKDLSHESHSWVGAKHGDRITGFYVYNRSINTSLDVKLIRLLLPDDFEHALEDSFYDIRYGYEGVQPKEWSFQTDADWLQWDNNLSQVYGTPDNGDVGIYNVSLEISDENGHGDKHAFELRVLNRPPAILNEDLKIAFEDETYLVDYSSDDDGQGTITWFLKHNSTFLSINTTTGNLSGIPTNKDLGVWWVNVSVDDGNGGWDWSNFTLNVLNTNDPPEITTEYIAEAKEDIEYYQQFEAIDSDVNDTTFEWDLETNADWLTLNKTIGVLKGTPDNTDVGVSYVNISVRDPGNAFDFHNYSLKVHNAPPMILTRNVNNVTEDQEYLVDYDSDDDEQGGVRWGIETEAKWLSINSSTGVLKGTPRNKDVGLEFVMLWANDGYDKGYSNFYIEVINTNDPPSFTSNPIFEVKVDSEYRYDVNATDIDKGDSVEYYLIRGPQGMGIHQTSGLILWTPQKGQEGSHEVLIEAKDRSNETINQTFNILVHPYLNVTIVKPIEGQNVSGKLKVRGTVIGPDDVKVEINLDNSSWIEAEGNVSWTYMMRTKKLENGNHTIKVRATWGDYKSEEATVTFLVDNPVKTKEEDNGWMMWIVILLLFIMALALLVNGMRKKKAEREITAEDSTNEKWKKMDDSEE